MRVAPRIAGFALAAVLAATSAAAQDPGELLGRIASIQSQPGKQSGRLLDAGVLTLLRWKQTRMPGPGGGSSELRLLATPVLSVLETDSSEDPASGRSALRILPVLGARLFESSRSTLPDALSGSRVDTRRWDVLKLPVLGSLLGAETRGQETSWSFFFVDPD